MTFLANVSTSVIPRSVVSPHASTGAPVGSILRPVCIKQDVIDCVAIETESFLSTPSMLTNISSPLLLILN